MKFGPRLPSLNKRLAARTSPTRYLRHNLGHKAPRGWGWLTNPRKAAPGTIRGDLGTLFTENQVHGSDGPESAAREIEIFFPNL